MSNDSANALSTKDYWDEVLKKAMLPRINSYKNYGYRVTMDYIHDVLKGSEGKTMLEIGCGSSGWLPYFQKRYDLRISGLDYSRVGCEVAVENLKMQQIPFDEIYCKDFLDKDFSLPRQFDFIFSYGVIEHFEKTEEVISIFKKLLAPGGKMITLVPNLHGLNGLVTRKCMPDIYLLHKVMDNRQLLSYHSDNGLSIIKSNYTGTFSIAVLPFANSENWLFRKGTSRRKFALNVLGKLDSLVSKFLKITRINLPSKMLSPYIICIAEG